MRLINTNLSRQQHSSTAAAAAASKQHCRRQHHGSNSNRASSSMSDRCKSGLIMIEVRQDEVICICEHSSEGKQ